MDDSLKWAPPEEVVSMAKEAGLTTTEIVRIVSGCLTYAEALEVAHEYAPLLEISVKEFMQLRKNA
jgi:DNA-binding XRE family transcriptional regulator